MESNYISMSKEVTEIKSLILSPPTVEPGHRTNAGSTVMTNVNSGDDLQLDLQLDLSLLFMAEAEANRPWLSIGIDAWIQAGRWWLMKVCSLHLRRCMLIIFRPKLFY